jgi:hypothetical protein
MSDVTPLPVPMEAHLLVADGYAVLNRKTRTVVHATDDEESAMDHAIYLCMEADDFTAYEVCPFRLLED